MVLFCLRGVRSGDGRERILRGRERIRKKNRGLARSSVFLLYGMGCWRSLWAVGHSPAFGKELDVRNVNGWPYISAHNS